MKKKITIALLAILLVTGCTKAAPKLADGKESFISFKDGSQISIDDVWNQMKEEYALDVALELVNKKILEQKFADKLNDAKEYAETSVASVKASYTDEEQLESALQSAGFSSLDQYKEKVYVNYLSNLATKEYISSTITEKEIKDYYKDETVGDIDCDHILVTPASDSTDDQNAAKKKAEGIIQAIKKDIKSGTKAKDAFAKYKDDKSVTYQTLGYFNKGDMVSEFEKAAFDLKVGEYSTKPVKTSYGYHVILKNDAKEKPSYEDSKDSIKEKLVTKKQNEDSKASTNAMIELRKEYGVKWNDSEVERQYDKYMNYLLNQKS